MELASLYFPHSVIHFIQPPAVALCPVCCARELGLSQGWLWRNQCDVRHIRPGFSGQPCRANASPSSAIAACHSAEFESAKPFIIGFQWRQCPPSSHAHTASVSLACSTWPSRSSRSQHIERRRHSQRPPHPSLHQNATDPLNKVYTLLGLLPPTKAACIRVISMRSLYLYI